MFKEIIFSSTKSFDQKPISVLLDPHINVIIGPKGGGKSTLFDLLVGLKQNCFYKNVKDALNEFNLKFEKAILFNNEIINASQLKEIKTKDEKKKHYENRFDVIYQDDPIKKNLTNFSDINKKKTDYLKHQIHHSADVNQLINDLKKLYHSMNKLNNFNQMNHINWSTTFAMKNLMIDDKLKIINNLAYKNNDLKFEVENELKEIAKLSQNIQVFNNQIAQTKRNSNINFTSIINDEKFLSDLNHSLEKITLENTELVKLLNQRKTKLEKILKVSSFFMQSYQFVIDQIKKNSFSSSGLQSYQINAINHFKDLADEIINLKKIFEHSLNQERILKIPNQPNQEDGLTYFIEENIELTKDDLTTKLLKVIFHSAGASREDLVQWLKKLNEKGIKEFNEDKLYEKLTEILKNNVKVLVDGNQDYETLSLGQRSIYGFKYKFNQSLDADLFLDQPEDNLDNKTIANEILNLLSKKKEQQIFIVTHNANIGILSNPQRVIIADLANHNNPYESIELTSEMNNQSANYLEGGRLYLEQRFRKIMEDK